MATTVGERDVSRLWPVGLVLILPLVGLAVLIVQPELDMTLEHHPAHFWIVLIAAAVNVVLAYVTNLAAGRFQDARLTLISLAFLVERRVPGAPRPGHAGRAARQPEHRVRHRHSGRPDHRVGVRGRVGDTPRRTPCDGRPPRRGWCCCGGSSR